MANEENQESTELPKNPSIYRHGLILAKVIEIVLGVFAVGLIVDPFNSFHRIFNRPRVKLDDIAFIYMTIGGYIIINVLFLICHLLGDRLPKRTVILFGTVGAIFHVVAGSVMVHDWRKISGPYFHMVNDELYPSKQYVDMLISAAVFTFFNGLAFLIEIFFYIRYT